MDKLQLVNLSISEGNDTRDSVSQMARVCDQCTVSPLSIKFLQGVDGASLA